jgi:hypothetical protein
MGIIKLFYDIRYTLFSTQRDESCESLQFEARSKTSIHNEVLVIVLEQQWPTT